MSINGFFFSSLNNIFRHLRQLKRRRERSEQMKLSIIIYQFQLKTLSFHLKGEADFYWIALCSDGHHALVREISNSMRCNGKKLINNPKTKVISQHYRASLAIWFFFSWFTTSDDRKLCTFACLSQHCRRDKKKLSSLNTKRLRFVFKPEMSLKKVNKGWKMCHEATWKSLKR